MNLESVMQELEMLGKERTKKIYQTNGAHEPLFGVATGEMKPIYRRIKLNQPLAEQLYATGNYDAMYFAGVIADPKAMSEADFERWIERAYFYMLSDFVVAVTLAETDIAQDVADKWIASDIELKMSAGWSCYCWLLGNRPDSEFAEAKIADMLELIKNTIHDAPDRAKYAMNNFMYTVAASYLPLHDKAVEVAKEVGPVEVNRGTAKSKLLNASVNIEKLIEKGKLGFKRKYVRC
ncbi:MAG: DNA alkylation repair protein [Candidatus Cohnella colombiensis]|uniref:DNA alkylation repair protein n=1 Tax=Candidatus Cohnella colombiensis TaxID=3121368 RepID=A0AA95EY76_9BACL|nr:MAG: DNA alkylation repair protein [Cohnella sp.]